MKNLYAGGLAEIVTNPSPLTYSYLKKWFAGRTNIGQAMKLLRLPYESIEGSVLIVVKKQLYVDLDTEEQTLYAKTIFSYNKQSDPSDLPSLKINLRKIVSPPCLFNTLKILLIQAEWLSSPQKTVQVAKKLLQMISDDTLDDSKVFPPLIAIGLLNEFYQQVVKDNELKNYVARRSASRDWLFRSISDQEKVKNGALSFNEFIKEYGIRADNDYELTCPRWYEIPKIIKKRIRTLKMARKRNQIGPEINKNMKDLLDALIELQIIRSQARKKSLYFINRLRKSLKLGQMVKNIEFKENIKTKVEKNKGIPISAGITIGKVQQVTSADAKIKKGGICIFTNAGVEFGHLYSRCQGIIFLQGGQTSHGAIIAREFGIPALIDMAAVNLPDGAKIKIVGKSGVWSIVP